MPFFIPFSVVGVLVCVEDCVDVGVLVTDDVPVVVTVVVVVVVVTVVVVSVTVVVGGGGGGGGGGVGFRPHRRRHRHGRRRHAHRRHYPRYSPRYLARPPWNKQGSRRPQSTAAQQQVVKGGSSSKSRFLGFLRIFCSLFFLPVFFLFFLLLFPALSKTAETFKLSPPPCRWNHKKHNAWFPASPPCSLLHQPQHQPQPIVVCTTYEY